MDKKEELLEKYQHAIMLHFFAMGKHRGLVGRAGRPVDNPSSGQGRVIACLKLKDGIGIKDLAQILGMSVPSLNDLLMKMEYGGFVERRPVSDGDTISQVFLTEKGKAVKQNDSSAATAHDSADVDPLEGFTDEELEIMDVYLDRMIANLEANVGMDEIEKNGWTLVPSKYIEFIDHDLEIDYASEMKRIRAEMKAIMQQERESQKMLIDAFKGIGYEVE